MKKNIRLISLTLAVCLMTLLLCACGSSAKNVPVSDIAAKVDEALAKDGALTDAKENYIKGYLKMDVADYEEYVVKINAYGENIDEYGVFKGKDASQAAEIKSAVEAYLELRLSTWMDEYMPEEKPKLQSAEVKTSGNYVMYCILSDADKTAAFAAFSDSLK